MDTATVGNGKKIHELKSTWATVCGSEFGAHYKPGMAPSPLHGVDGKVNCVQCIRKAPKHHPEPEPVSVSKNYGPNASTNFVAMMKSAKTEAGKLSWARRLYSMGYLDGDIQSLLVTV